MKKLATKSINSYTILWYEDWLLFVCFLIPRIILHKGHWLSGYFFWFFKFPKCSCIFERDHWIHKWPTWFPIPINDKKDEEVAAGRGRRQRSRLRVCMCHLVFLGVMYPLGKGRSGDGMQVFWWSVQYSVHLTKHLVIVDKVLKNTV